MDVPPRPSNPQPLQSIVSLDITLSLSPIIPLENLSSPSSPSPPPPPQPPIMGHPLYYNYHDYHGSTYCFVISNRGRLLGITDLMITKPINRNEERRNKRKQDMLKKETRSRLMLIEININVEDID
ncbi:hypothetical protein Tco_0495930 [Tanacetum coccineum]